MNNDLISREALKKVFLSYDYLNMGLYTMSMSDIIKLIDNAPTIEPFEPDYVGAERVKARQRGYEQGYHEGIKTGKTLSPKIKLGEWNKTIYGFYTCSICDSYGNPNFFKFCPNCGAYMRKGGADMRKDEEDG